MTQDASTMPLAADPFYPPLKRLVIERTGLAYYDDRESDLMRKLQLRLDAGKMCGCEAYLGLLRDEFSGRTEFDALIAELTIGETHFFRHREMFDALREIVLPNVVERNRACRRIRVWSAGCSIGAEAYSMSILIREFLGDRSADWDVSILGTDINREYLAKAKRGAFDDWALRSLSDDFRMRYFERRQGSWAVLPSYRRDVTFQYHNLVKHRFPSLVQNLVAFDIVLCRNVMIYFSKEVNGLLVANLHDALADDGWLVVGHSEPQGALFGAFRRVLAEGAVLYQKPSATELANTTVFHRKNVDQPRFERTPRAADDDAPTRQSAGRLCKQNEADAAPASTTRDTVDQSLAEVRALADRGELEQAARRCAKLLEERKLCPKVNFHFALLMEQTGRIDDAERSLRKTLYLDCKYVLAHYYLGLTHLRKGDNAAAQRALENVLDLTDRIPVGDNVEGAEEMNVGDLRQLAQMHLSLLLEQ